MAVEPSRRSVKEHRAPAWWRDAKLGIFVHWTPASVAGWAPTEPTLREVLASTRPDAFAAMPYTEWYENSLRFPDSPVSHHHREVWGDRPYEDFGDDFRDGLEGWDPDAWARRFAATGAGYVVLVAKHADGFCLWPSDVRNPHRDGWGTGRDVVGELAEAVRGVGLRFGLYYSGGLDSTFDDRPLGNFVDTALAVPRGAYPAYAEAQVRELVTRYRPSILWNDIAWPQPRGEMLDLLSWYYAAVPDGVVNDRWLAWSPAFAALRFGPVQRALIGAGARAARRRDGLVPPAPTHCDFRTTEYTSFAETQRRPWECVRGIDRSFGYNRASGPELFIGHGELIGLLADVVSKGGNLLLNVGPRGEDATIPDEQLRRLDWLAAWTAVHGDAVKGTRPWVRPAATGPEGTRMRFTSRDDTLWCIVETSGAGPAGGTGAATSGASTSGASTSGASTSSGRRPAVVTIPGVRPRGRSSEVRVEGVPVPFTAGAAGVSVDLEATPDRPGDEGPSHGAGGSAPGSDGARPWFAVALRGFEAAGTAPGAEPGG